MAGAEASRGGGRAGERGIVHPVLPDLDLVGGQVASRDQMIGAGPIERRHQGRMPVDPLIDGAQPAKEAPVSPCLGLTTERLRIEVLDRAHHRDRAMGEGASIEILSEKRPRVHVDHVRPGRAQQLQGRGEPERQVLGQPGGRDRAPREGVPTADDPQLAPLLDLAPGAAMAGQQTSGGAIGKRREHGDLVAATDQLLGNVSGDRRRSHWLGRKDVGDDVDTHRAAT